MRLSLKPSSAFAWFVLSAISFCACSAAWAQFSNPFSSSPSFGIGSRKNVTLQSKLPPTYNARGKTVSVVAADALLKIALEKQLTQSDSSIRVVEANSELLIECSVSQNHPMHDVTVTDSTGSSKEMQGDLSVIFRISEPRTRQVIKSDIASANVQQVLSTTTNPTTAGKVFGIKTKSSGPVTSNHAGQFASGDDAENYLVTEIARKIASYLVNTEIPITIPLAIGGTLNGPNKYADGGLWPRYLEALEVTTPYPDPKNEAYRLYDIGVANEALAYGALDNKAAIKFLDEASNDYGKALDDKPQEKGFIEAQSRIKAALQRYADIGKTSPMGAPGALTTSLTAAAAAPGTLTNKDIIDMVAGHLDEANITDTIVNAPDVNFDISPQGQIALGKAGVTPRLIMAMKDRQRGGAPPRRTR